MRDGGEPGGWLGPARVDAAERAGNGANQDRILVGDRLVAVFDGASAHPPVATGPDGGWYAAALSAAVDDQIPDLTPDGPLDLVGVLAAAVDAVADEYVSVAVPAARPPSGTAVLAGWRGGAMEVLALGDSTAVIFLRGGRWEVVTDRPLDEVALGVQELIRGRLAAGSGFDRTHRELLAELQVEQRRWRNREGGYWIADATSDGRVARRAVRRSWDSDEVEAVLLVSDGVSVGVEQYGRPPSWAAARALVADAGAAALVDVVHAAEEEDADGRRWPRYKRHDDKSVVLVRPAAGGGQG